MSYCVFHPGRKAVMTYANQHYCAQCEAGIQAARLRVDRHVEPKDCFVWYASADNWQPISGTGCAHWVAHQLGIRRGSSSEKCREGYSYRVRTLIQGLRRIELKDVRANDIYVTPRQDHTGLVIRVAPNPVAGKPPRITIRHDSSNQGRVADNDFQTYFHGRGDFYR